MRGKLAILCPSLTKITFERDSSHIALALPWMNSAESSLSVLAEFPFINKADLFDSGRGLSHQCPESRVWLEQKVP